MHTGTRLYHVSKDIFRGEGDRESVTLISTGAGENPSEQLLEWSILFDLAIPGWLPPTVDISKFTETRYNLHARETIGTSPFFKSNTSPNTPGSRDVVSTLSLPGTWDRYPPSSALHSN